jgi:4-amino-4-deoxy-L-arabinose transferase-like glycosyltransferase
MKHRSTKEALIRGTGSFFGTKNVPVPFIAAMKNIGPHTWLTVILLFALSLRLYFFVGLNWADDPWYVNEANEVLKGHFHPDNNLNRRIATYLPMAFFFYLFEINEFTAVLFPLICSLAEIILIFAIGKRFLNEKVGLMAAFFLAIYPLNVNYSTMAMGDVPISLFGSLAVILFLLAREKAWLEYSGFRKRMETWLLFFAAGFIAYFSYLIKELGLLPPLFMFACYVYDIVRKRSLNFHYSFVLVGFLAALLMEAGVYYLMGTVDPFVSLNQGINFFNEDDNLGNLSLHMNYYARYMFKPDFIFSLGPSKQHDWFYYNYFSFFFYLVGIGIVYLVVKRKKAGYPVIGWLLFMFLWMQFGSMSYTRYIPMHRLDRHLTIITIPAILLFSAALYEWMLSRKDRAAAGRPVRQSLAGIVVLTLCVFWFSNLSSTTRFQKGRTEDVREIYETIKDIDRPIYTSEHAAAFLRFLSGYRKDNFMVIPDISCKKARESYLVTNAELGWILSDAYISTLPPCVLNPPANWKLVKTIDTPFKEPPYNRFNPKIYYLP